MPIKPGSTPSPPPSAVKSHQSPCGLSFCSLPGPNWIPTGLLQHVLGGEICSLCYSQPAAHGVSLVFPLQIQGKREIISFFKGANDCLRLPDPKEEDGSVLHPSSSSFLSPCPLQLHQPHSTLVKKQLLQRNLGDYFGSKWLSSEPVRSRNWLQWWCSWTSRTGVPVGTMLVLLLTGTVKCQPGIKTKQKK